VGETIADDAAAGHDGEMMAVKKKGKTSNSSD